MSAVAERSAAGAIWSARGVAVRVPACAAQLAVVRRVGELLFGAGPGRLGEEQRHPRMDDVLVVANEFVTNAVDHGDQGPVAQVYVRFAVSAAGWADVFVCNELGVKPPVFVRLPEDLAKLGPLTLPCESGMGLRAVVPGLADLWSVEVVGPTVVARAGFGVSGGTS